MKKKSKEEEIEKKIKIIDVNIDLLALDRDHHITASTTLLVLGLSSFIASFVVPREFWKGFAFLFVVFQIMSFWQTYLRRKKTREMRDLYNRKIKLLRK